MTLAPLLYAHYVRRLIMCTYYHPHYLTKAVSTASNAAFQMFFHVGSTGWRQGICSNVSTYAEHLYDTIASNRFVCQLSSASNIFRSFPNSFRQLTVKCGVRCKTKHIHLRLNVSILHLHKDNFACQSVITQISAI